MTREQIEAKGFRFTWRKYKGVDQDISIYDTIKGELVCTHYNEAGVICDFNRRNLNQRLTSGR